MDSRDAEDALLAVADARKRLAARTTWPLRRHVAAGAVMGAMVASAGLPLVVAAIVMSFCLFAVMAIKDYDRRHDGFFVSGYKAGPTRWVALVILVLSVCALLASLHAKYKYGWWAAPFVAGIAIFFVATFGSICWERVNQSNLAGKE